MQIEQLIVGPLFSNCYIVSDKQTSEGIIIDPGDDANAILAMINELGINIKYIVATHGHFDHIGAVNTVKEKTKAPFLAHEEDLFFIRDAVKSAQKWGIEIEKPPLPDKFIKEPDEVKIKNIKFKVIDSPGHSPGGICLLNDKVIFCGDTLFQGSIGRTDFRKGSFEQLSKSIKTKIYTLPEDTIVYAGHGPNTTIGFEKRTNPFVRG